MDDKLCVYCQVAETTGNNGLKYGAELQDIDSQADIMWGLGGHYIMRVDHDIFIPIHYCPMCGRKLGG